MKRAALLAAVGVLLAADAVLLVGVARRGPAETIFTLTADELKMPSRDEENAPLVLRLQWRRPESPPDPAFGLPSNRPAALPAWAVLELRPEAAPGATRLQVIDAGAYLPQLRAKYPDRTRYAISRAVVSTAPKSWLRLIPDLIYVPPEHLPAFRSPGYGVNLCYGQRGQVWVCGATR